MTPASAGEEEQPTDYFEAPGQSPHLIAPETLGPGSELTPFSLRPIQQQVADQDGTRVEVQLVVLGIAAFTVVGVGGAGYLLRRKLGRIPPPPEQPAPGSHH
ncbi:MAG: hypothetical protein WEC75_03715 [Dehalococcoidia bacterium]